MSTLIANIFPNLSLIQANRAHAVASLWVRGFQTVEELRQGLQAFKETYNTRWRVGRHGYRTPEQYRAKLLSAHGKAA